MAESKPVPARVARNAGPLLTRGVALPIAPVAPNVHDAAVAPIPPMEPDAETMGLPNPQHVMKPPVTAPSQSQTKKAQPHG
jgi:hypothetical protein